MNPIILGCFVICMNLLPITFALNHIATELALIRRLMDGSSNEELDD